MFKWLFSTRSIPDYYRRTTFGLYAVYTVQYLTVGKHGVITVIETTINKVRMTMSRMSSKLKKKTIPFLTLPGNNNGFDYKKNNIYYFKDIDRNLKMKIFVQFKISGFINSITKNTSNWLYQKLDTSR